MKESHLAYPDTLEIKPLALPPVATIHVPGSKSITNRAMVLAALSNGGCRLRGVLRSDDTEIMAEALARLGFIVESCWDQDRLDLRRPAGGQLIPSSRAELFVGNSGTSMRFLTAIVSLGHGTFCLDGVERMRERPIQDLLDALQQLDVPARCRLDNGCPPVILTPNGLKGGKARIRGDLSSQFLSGLLMAAPWADGEIIIEVDGPLVSAPYVAMTVAMMRQWDLRVHASETLDRFCIPGKQRGSLAQYAIEPDASAASYFLGAAAITGGQISIPGLERENSLQGDVEFCRCLERMGCDVQGENRITVQGGALRGIDVDMNAISDCVMTLAALACFAAGPTTIRNVAHIRHKETDRLHALAVELRRIGARVDEQDDGLKITPGPLHGALIETYNDHRMAMSMALVGLLVPGIVIKNPACVAKTYPGFFEDLEKLRRC